MGVWLRHARRAARFANDRSDLWPAGALGYLAYVGWVPLLLAILPPIDAGGIAYFGAKMAGATAFPWNVVVLAAAVSGIILLLALLVAVSDAALIGSVAERSVDGASAIGSAFAILIVAGLPLVAAFAALSLGVAAVAPGLFLTTSSLAEILGVVAGRLWPFILAAAVLFVVAQAFGAVAMRLAFGLPDRLLPGALRAAARDLARHPVRRLGTALVVVAVDAATLLLSAVVLRLLWSPIGEEITGRRFPSPTSLVLLVGFVAIWLALVLAAGLFRSWVSTWWTLEVGAGQGGGVADGA